MAAFELWELESGNFVGSFPTKEAALAVVARTLSELGSDGYATIETTLLTWENGDESKEIAMGKALIDMASSFSSSLSSS
jgi:hypothetical protein